MDQSPAPAQSNIERLKANVERELAHLNAHARWPLSVENRIAKRHLEGKLDGIHAVEIVLASAAQ